VQKLICTAVTLACILLGVAPARAEQPDAAVERRVDDILSKMTLEEKIDLLGGVDGFFVRAIPRVGLPKLKMADGPVGVRNFGPATAMAGGIGLAAAWNPDLAERVGVELGRDARAKGVHFLLGPGVNIYRAPMNGRNFEYFGEDPFLASRTAVGYIKGVQSQGVSATVKHFMGNNSEFLRHDSDSIIDERTMREIYLPVFEAAVKEAHVGAIMDSYNLTNGQHLTQNGYLNTEVAKKQWGFDGIMMSDWFSTYDAVGAANGGLDLEMPGGAFLNRDKLLPAVKSGQVSVATIDDKVRRILRTAVRFGWLDRDQTDPSISRYNQAGRAVALEAAREGVVLLKNDGGVLPISKTKVKTIAVVGPDAYPAVPVGGGSARVEPFAAVSLLQGLGDALGVQADVLYDAGLPTLDEMAEATTFATAATNGKPGLAAEYFASRDLGGAPVTTRTDEHVNFGRGGRELVANTASERWTGYFTPATAGDHDVFVKATGEDGGSFRLRVDDKVVLDNWDTNPALANYATIALDARPHKIVLEHRGRSFWLGGRLAMGVVRPDDLVTREAKALAAKADVVVVAAGFSPDTESEGADRTFRLPPGQDALIRQMAATNKSTVVVLTSGGAVDATRWIDSVPALVEAWYPGQGGGTALAQILLGDVNPSGRLPISYDRRWEESPVHGSYYLEPGTKRVVYKEGVFVGYRGYEHANVKPLFPFGYGLSYTTFELKDLSVKPANGGYEVSFDVKNTGDREGAEVAEVYVGNPAGSVPRPVKELRGFSKVRLKPGESKRVTVALDERAFSYYDVDAKQWRVAPGAYEILVGRSSADIDLRATAPMPAR
jgi:beta-glucosidase